MPVSTVSHTALRGATGLSARTGFVHGFTEALDLAVSERQPRAQTAAAWQTVLDALGVEHLALVSQVHGDVIHRAYSGTGALDTGAEADAVYTTEVGLAVAIRVADCVPVLLAGPGIVAAVHAGWRGVAARIVPKAVAEICAVGGCSPAELHAVVGPHICGRHYEVGPEVVRALREAGIPERAFVVPGRGQRPHLDGGCAVTWQLADSGVERVEHVRACTWEEDSLHSWRRSGVRAGRLAGVIALRPR